MDFEDWWTGTFVSEFDGIDANHVKAAWNAAIYAARAECLKNAYRPHDDAPDTVGERNCIEISAAISGLVSK